MTAAGHVGSATVSSIVDDNLGSHSILELRKSSAGSVE